jgi:hypothetical protein
VSASTLSKAKIGLPHECKTVMPGNPNSLYIEANLIKKSMTPETAAQDIKNQLKSSIDNEKLQDLE